MHALNDMHCHLDLMAHGLDVAHEAARAGALVFSNTTTPRAFSEVKQVYAHTDNVTVGVGLHPWYAAGITDDDIEYAQAAISAHRFVGEIGLDAAAAHLDSMEAQKRAFSALAASCGREGGRVLSIHAVHAAGAVLDILQNTGALATCTCIFHWFSGTSDELARARAAGCLFSVGNRMLARKRGQAYVAQVKPTQLLLETDFPLCAGDDCSFEEMQASLTCTLDAITAVHGPSVAEAIQENAVRVLRR